jgi:hypothetical protein
MVVERTNRVAVETLWDRGGRSPYQTRVKCGAFRIHIFWRGDRDPDMHDHPATFWTFPLVSYVEEVLRGGHTRRRVVRAFRPHFRKAPFPHRVLGAWTGEFSPQTGEPTVCPRPIVTLAWWGKKRREWGFLVNGGWVPWRAYVSQPGWDKAATQPEGGEHDAG